MAVIAFNNTLANDEWTLISESCFGVVVSKYSGSGTVYLYAEDAESSVVPDISMSTDTAIALASSDYPKRIDFEGVYPIKLYARSDTESGYTLDGYVLWDGLAKPVDADRTILDNENENDAETADDGTVTGGLETHAWLDFKGEKIYDTSTDAPFPIVALLKRILSNGKYLYNNTLASFSLEGDSSTLTYTANRNDTTSTTDGETAENVTFTLPAADIDGTAGLLTNEDQTVAGNKSYNGSLTAYGADGTDASVYAYDTVSKLNGIAIKSSSTSAQVLSVAGDSTTKGSLKISLPKVDSALSIYQNGTKTLQLEGTYVGNTDDSDPAGDAIENVNIISNGNISAYNFYELTGSEGNYGRTSLRTLFASKLSTTKGSTEGEIIDLVNRASTPGILSTIKLDSASSTVSGVVTTTTQTFAGDKTFANNVNITGNLAITGITTGTQADFVEPDTYVANFTRQNTGTDTVDTSESSGLGNVVYVSRDTAQAGNLSGIVFRTKNAAWSWKADAFIGSGLSDTTTDAELGKVVIAPRGLGVEPYRREDFTITAISTSQSAFVMNGNLTVTDGITADVTSAQKVDHTLTFSSDGVLESTFDGSADLDSYVPDQYVNIASAPSFAGITDTGNLTVAGTASVANTLSVSGATTLGSTLEVADLATFNGGQTVIGTSTFDSLVSSDLHILNSNNASNTTGLRVAKVALGNSDTNNGEMLLLYGPSITTSSGTTTGDTFVSIGYSSDFGLSIKMKNFDSDGNAKNIVIGRDSIKICYVNGDSSTQTIIRPSGITVEEKGFFDVTADTPAS